jgi:hypothetical protein
MLGKHLYEYAVIRIVPRVEREEFINVGVVVFCKNQNFLKTLYHLDREKLEMFNCETDCNELEENLAAFEKICKGEKDVGPIAQWNKAERFRWLTAVRSSVIQTSRPHNGFSDDLEKTTKKLFEEMVL